MTSKKHTHKSQDKSPSSLESLAQETSENLIVLEDKEKAGDLFVPFKKDEEGFLPSCQVIFRNNGFSFLRCLGWKNIGGVTVSPPPPLIYSKTEVNFFWQGLNPLDNFQGAFTYRSSGGLEDHLDVFLYFDISPRGENKFFLNFFQGDGLYLDRIPSLENNSSVVSCLAESHVGIHHTMASLSETSSAVIIVDLWNDYG